MPSPRRSAWRVARLAVLALVALLAPARQLAAQQILRSEIRRPSLPREADANDWEAYYDEGMRQLAGRPDRAEAYFLWAARVDPSRAEPLFGLWITFWARDMGRFERSLKGDEKVLRSPEVLSADSLRLLALRRNPFVHQGLIVFLYDRLPGRWNDDDVTRGMIRYGEGRLGPAIDIFSRLITRYPEKYGHLRYRRASAFVNLGRFGEAAGDVDTLLAGLRAHDEKALVREYESKELLEYARGLLHLQSGQVAEAREAFGRALSENPGFSPAHGQMADLALAAHDTATALSEYALAVEVSPDDVLLRLGYGRALAIAGRGADAVTQFRTATTLAPEYAEPWFRLGEAQRAMRDASAREAYARFLQRAKRADARREPVERMMAALGAGG